MTFRALIAAALLLSPIAAQARTGGETIEQRLQRLEDKDAIRDIIEEYAVRLTSRDFDGYVALFAEDGVWMNGDIVQNGRDQIKAMLVNMFPDTPADYVNDDSYMIVSNIQIEVDGDRATANSRQLSIIRGADGGPTPVLSGRYEDEFIRKNGEWKILKRNDITLIPTPEEWARRMQEGVFSGN